MATTLTSSSLTTRIQSETKCPPWWSSPYTACQVWVLKVEYRWNAAFQLQPNMHVNNDARWMIVWYQIYNQPNVRNQQITLSFPLTAALWVCRHAHSKLKVGWLWCLTTSRQEDYYSHASACTSWVRCASVKCLQLSSNVLAKSLACFQPTHQTVSLESAVEHNFSQYNNYIN